MPILQIRKLRPESNLFKVKQLINGITSSKPWNLAAEPCSYPLYSTALRELKYQTQDTRNYLTFLMSIYFSSHYYSKVKCMELNPVVLNALVQLPPPYCWSGHSLETQVGFFFICNLQYSPLTLHCWMKIRTQLCFSFPQMA